MKREAFFTALLVLSLFSLPILPITAPKPSRQESVSVQLVGPDITSSSMTFDVDVQNGGKNVIVHSAYESTVDLMFVGDALWRVDSDFTFAGVQNGKLAFRVDPNSNGANVVFNFGEYTPQDVAAGVIIDRYEGWLKYQLTGNGQWSGGDISHGSVSIDEEFSICQLFYTPSGKGKGNSATGGSCVEVWSGVLTFTIDINP
jgi:hypothetical protein